MVRRRNRHTPHGKDFVLPGVCINKFCDTSGLGGGMGSTERHSCILLFRICQGIDWKYFCVDWDAKPHSLTHSIHSPVASVQTFTVKGTKALQLRVAKRTHAARVASH